MRFLKSFFIRSLDFSSLPIFNVKGVMSNNAAISGFFIGLTYFYVNNVCYADIFFEMLQKETMINGLSGPYNPPSETIFRAENKFLS
jgi:hypothetical protein